MNPIKERPDPLQEELQEELQGESPIHRLVLGEERLFSPQQIEKMNVDQQNSAIRTWRLILDQDYLKRFPFLVPKLIQDLEKTHFTIIDSSLDNFILQLPPQANENDTPKGFYQKETGPVGTPLTDLQRKFPIWQAIKSETSLADRKWDIHLDKKYLKSSTITLDQLRSLLHYFKIGIIEENPDWFRIEIPNDQTPSIYLRQEYNRYRPTLRKRKLTKDEIEDILRVIPKVESADPLSGNSAREGIINTLREQLESIKITPIGIPDLKDEILANFEESVIHPGSMVGVTAAEALGQPITQMALKSVDWKEKILIFENGETKALPIGWWIDQMIFYQKGKITLIPENQTEHLVLDQEVLVPSTDEDGNVNWHPVTAVMRHLPGGDLIQIKTASGRTLTASKHRSFLRYQNGKLEGTYGSEMKVGDLIPITRNLPSLEKIDHLDEFELDEEFGYLTGSYFAAGYVTGDSVFIHKREDERIAEWANRYPIQYQWEGNELTIFDYRLADIFRSWKIPQFESLSFAKGLLHGYYKIKGRMKKDSLIINGIYRSSMGGDPEDLILRLASLSSHFGIFGQIEDNSYILRGKYRDLFISKIGIFDNYSQESQENSNLQVYLESLLERITFLQDQLRNFKGEEENLSCEKELNDVILDPVIEITEVPSTHPFVYDLTVPKTLRFALFSGINCMDSFHQSGSAKTIGSGVDAIRELLNVSANRKVESCTIYFKRQDLTFDDIYNKIRTIVDTTVFDLMYDYDIESATNLGLTWWHHLYQASTGKYYRNNTYNKSKKDLSEVSWVLRLYLNVSDIYKYQITMEQIVETIQENNENVLFTIPSPINLGIIDVFPIESNIPSALTAQLNTQKKRNYSLGKTGDLSTLIFLDKFTLPRMEKISIKGIPKIKALFPQEAVTLQIVKEEIKAYTDEQIRSEKDPQMRVIMDRTWLLIYNRARLIQSGIRPEKLKNLVEAVGMTVYRMEDNYMTVIMPVIPEHLVKEDEKIPIKIRKSRTLPSNWIAYKIKEDQEEKEKVEKEERKAGNLMYHRQSTNIERESKVFYAETNGSNLIGLLSHPEVDQTRTVCNNIHQVYETFGIEAARTMLIKEFDFVIREAGSSINSRNIILLVDFMMNLGQPTAITFSGISRTPIGATAKASFERAMDTFINEAGIGKREAIRGTTPSIYVGQRARLGTGFMDIVIDQKKINEYEERVAAQQRATGKEPTVNAAEFSQAVNDLNPDDLVFHRDLAHPEDSDEDISALLVPTGQPQVEMAPDLIITNKSVMTGPLIKGRPVRPQPLNAVKELLNKVPQLPNKPLPKNVSFNLPLSSHTASVLNRPRELSLPPIENEGLGLSPAIADLIKALAPNVSSTRIALFPKETQEKVSQPTVRVTPQIRLGEMPQIRPAPRPKPAEVPVEIVDLDEFLEE